MTYLTARLRLLFGWLWGAVADFHNRTVAFRVGRWVVTTYAFLAGGAFFVGCTVALWFVAMAGQSPEASARLHLLVTLPAALVGLRLFSVMTEWRKLLKRPLESIVRPGYMLHGGIFGGALGLVGVSNATGVPLLLYFDSAALALPIGEALARVGCHVYGCCWGRPTESPIAIRYTNPDASVLRNEPHLTGVRLYPIQLYSSAASLALFVLMVHLLPVKHFDGMLTATYCLLHPIGRFVQERFSQDHRGRLTGRWSHSNLYAGTMFVSGLALVAFQARLGDTPLDLGVRWTQIVTSPEILRWVLALDHQQSAGDQAAIRYPQEGTELGLFEAYRPFAPSILEEAAPEYFERITRAPFMLVVGTVRKDKRGVIPAVVHIDGTARPQTVSREVNPLYYELIESFCKLTGVPVVLNTSFNVAGEPIVCSPVAAIRCFHGCGLDALVIGRCVVEKTAAGLPDYIQTDTVDTPAGRSAARLSSRDT